MVRRRARGALPRADGCEWAETEERIFFFYDSSISEIFTAADDERGVDVTQIERMLALSPEQRLESLNASRRSVQELTGDAQRD